MAVIHLRDAKLRKQALHFHYAGFKEDQLTDDKSNVTCKICLQMLKRADSYKGGLDDNG